MPRRLSLPRPIALTALVAVLSAGCASDPPGPSRAPLGIGDVFPALSLEDPHGDVHDVGPGTEVVLFSSDMAGGRAIRDALEELPDDSLERRRAVYVTDISGMPGLIARTIAIPRMRGRPYPTLLDRDGEATARLPREADHATLLFLESREVVEIRFEDDPEAVAEVFGD